MAEVNVTKQNFEEEVINSDIPVLVDFWAPWCGPCKMLSPIIAEIANERPEIKVCKVNVDEEAELSITYNVASIPTIIIVKKGKIVNKSIGFSPKNEILELLNNI